MKAVTYSHARSNLARSMKRVCDDREPLLITRRSEESVVMMSQAEYEALEETAHLLRSPRNAKRLLESIEQLERGKGRKRKLAE